MFSFEDSSGKIYLRRNNTIGGVNILPLLSSSIVRMQFTDTGILPKTGTLRVYTSTPTSWPQNNGKVIVQFGGIFRCFDGYYGPNCSNLCLGGAGRAQCNRRGRCKDGSSGNGECQCLSNNRDPKNGCALCLKGWSGENCTIYNTPTITPTLSPSYTVTPTTTPTQVSTSSFTPTSTNTLTADKNVQSPSSEFKIFGFSGLLLYAILAGIALLILLSFLTLVYCLCMCKRRPVKTISNVRPNVQRVNVAQAEA
eukprot:NODE_1823_length_1791_cov_13.298561_g1546_i0.p1 GENE.NODE_1823_length_1791_cov_13.298561_g1546_i0~~NODE_1823_length_1791_cov_13.298561_g1546_i0.p1  ORF type:complete len:253 (+),score=33.28 NODE_1823_length_1791_cov_13.298561_g1546_i0:851-1609(+)